ncbi:MAG: DUF928 domain-containing protein [Sphingobacteriaceae bacterium]|nr:DUF928 domain-containing protein [Sphingobacteriaceae bacterium]
MLRQLFSILLFIISFPVLGQVSFQFIPELNGRNIDALMNIRVINISGPQTVTLSLIVTERKHGRVVSLKTQPFNLRNGSNNIPPATIRSSKVQFSGNRISTTVEENGVFPEGDYEYCFTINSQPNGPNQNAPVEQCFSYELVPTAPLSLIEPYDKDKICEKRPMLSWQPSFPKIPGSAYQLVLVEIKDRQNATEALNYNLPLISQTGINSPILPYPASAKELIVGKRYAWQVSMYKNQTVLNRSEVWEFTINCKEEEVVPVSNESFRHIDDLAKGNYYIARGYVRFYFDNAYNEKKLIYSIKGITDAKKKLKHLPKLQLHKGRNQISLDLNKIGGFKDGSYYVLTVQLPDGSLRNLRFVYKSQE